MNFSSLVRNIDPSTSVEAAQIIEPKLNTMQRQVFEWIRDHGPVIDSQLVALAYSLGYSESTLRKRRTELSQMGMLELCGERKTSAVGANCLGKLHRGIYENAVDIGVCGMAVALRPAVQTTEN